MLEFLLQKETINKLRRISEKAGHAIMDIYDSEFDFDLKNDQTPLTEADLLADKIICQSLRNIAPEIPILSEESSDIPFKLRSKWEHYWLVDPLDGTKEFIKRNGEFTVNIALISNNNPVIGVIHCPVLNETYWGSSTIGSFYSKDNNDEEKLNAHKKQSDVIKVAVSRSHPSEMLNIFLENIGDYELIISGSSLKFCLVARGLADIYPRFGPTSEWDTAAGQAILEFSGGKVESIEGKRIRYNTKDRYLNPKFLAHNNQEDLTKKWVTGKLMKIN